MNVINRETGRLILTGSPLEIPAEEIRRRLDKAFGPKSEPLTQLQQVERDLGLTGDQK